MIFTVQKICWYLLLTNSWDPSSKDFIASHASAPFRWNMTRALWSQQLSKNTKMTRISLLQKVFSPKEVGLALFSDSEPGCLSWRIICWCLCLANLDNFLSLMDLLDLLGHNNQTLNIQVIFSWETSRCQRFWKMNIFNVFWLLCSCHCVHLCPSLIAVSTNGAGSAEIEFLNLRLLFDGRRDLSGNITIWTLGANSELRC